MGWAALVWIVVSAPVAAAEIERARPVSPAERAGVQLAIDYFDRGPAAWWESLAAEAPLRALDQEAALAEIEVRAGRTEGATWELRTPAPRYDDTTVIFAIEFPSGHDEVLALELVDEDGWRIAEIRSLEDPTEIGPTLDDLGAAAPRLGPPTGAVWIAGLLALGALAWLSLPVRSRRLGAGAALGLALLLPACSGDGGSGVEDGSEVVTGPTRLGELLPLRRALTGRSEVSLEALFAAAPSSGVAGDVARLWRAAQLTQELRLDEAEEILETFPTPAAIPLAELTRARLAFFRGDDLETPLLYERALAQGIDHDGLRLEAAEVYGYLGLDDDAEILLRQLGEMKSRDAEVYYALARLAALEDQTEEGEELFLAGWELEPVEREELFDDPLLAWLCTRDRLFPVLELGSVAEPSVARPTEDRDPVTLPEGATAFLSGESLRLAHREGKLVVLGGGPLAPGDVPVAPADEVTRRERAEALAQLDTLRHVVATGGVTRPVARQQALAAAIALAEADRWEELLDLTDGMKVEGSRPDPHLAQLRARALTESDRDSEAMRLLVTVAQGGLGNRLTAPSVLYQLAEIFVARQEFDLALRLLGKAEAVAGREIATQRIRQVQMERSLAEENQTYVSPNFRIRYPRMTGAEYAEQIGHVLEEERKRLLRWIPQRDPKPIDVDLFPLENFLDSYSQGVSVLGIYDGRVRVPFADLRSLHPQLVSILSHELAHAMIADATGDQAPKWFHEGLAQHVEMVQDAMNPIPDLVAASRVFTLPVVQSVLGGFAEQQFVELSYRQAAWSVHFIESRYGVGSLHRLLEAFGRGEDSETALAGVLGLTMEAFDREFWDWSQREAPTVWPSTIRRYDEEAKYAALTGSSRDSRVPRFDNEGFGRGRPTKADAMRDWHQIYSRQVEPIRARLAPLVRFLREGTVDMRIMTTCGELAQDLGRVQRDGKALQSADRDVNHHLRAAFDALETLTSACERGQTSLMVSQLDRAERSLTAAATAMRRYGLEP